MFRKFVLERSKQVFGDYSASEFKTRAAKRDAKSDHARIKAVLVAIEEALLAAQSEHEELRKRVDNVLSRAAVTFGNGNDEYLSREQLNSYHQDLFAAYITDGERRLQKLASSIPHLKFLHVAAMSRFSNIVSRD